jgi:hypothetical protein
MWAMGTPSFNGALYFLIFVDDYSRYTHIYFLHKKFEALTYFIKYKTLVENQTNKLNLYLFYVLIMGANLLIINLISFGPIIVIDLQIHTI